MAIRARENLIGAWFFLGGIVLAIIMGVLSRDLINPITLAILVILGLLVGLFVAERDVQTFLLVTVSLVIVSFAGISAMKSAEILGIGIGEIVSSTLGSLIVFFVPATLIIAIKTFFALAKS